MGLLDNVHFAHQHTNNDGSVTLYFTAPLSTVSLLHPTADKAMISFDIIPCEGMPSPTYGRVSIGSHQNRACDDGVYEWDEVDASNGFCLTLLDIYNRERPANDKDADDDPVYQAYHILMQYMAGQETNEAYVIETALGYLGQALDI